MCLLRKQRNAAGKVAPIEEHCGKRRCQMGRNLWSDGFQDTGKSPSEAGVKKVESTVRRKNQKSSSKFVKYHSDQNNSLHPRGRFWSFFWYRATAREIRLKSEGGVAEMQVWANVTGRKCKSMVRDNTHSSQTARENLHRYCVQKWFYQCVR